MAKSPIKPKKRAPKKESIKPPAKATLKVASKDLRKRDKAGARVMADKSVAIRQGVAKKAPPKKKR